MPALTGPACPRPGLGSGDRRWTGRRSPPGEWKSARIYSHSPSYVRMLTFPDFHHGVRDQSRAAWCIGDAAYRRGSLGRALDRGSPGLRLRRYRLVRWLDRIPRISRFGMARPPLNRLHRMTDENETPIPEQDSREAALADIDLSVPAGSNARRSSVRSARRKSTLAAIIPRGSMKSRTDMLFHRRCGHQSDSVCRPCASAIAMVPQDSFLFLD